MFNDYLLTYLFSNDILNLINVYNDLDNQELETLHFDFCKFLLKIDYMYYEFCKRLTTDQFKREITNLENEINKQLGANNE